MTATVVTVTPNGSVDTVLRRAGPEGDEEQEVIATAETAGGKGHNVARFLHALGVPVVACGFAGGPVGDDMRGLLEASGVATRLTPISGMTRRYTTVVGGGRARISYHMAGPRVTVAETVRLVDDVVSAASGGVLIVLAGSLPPGAPPDLYAQIARAVGPSRVWIDSSGQALAAGIAAAPAAVKVNREELRGLGIKTPASAEPDAWSSTLRGLSERSRVGSWWVTLGPAGAVGWEGGRAVGATAAAIDVVNTSGAGDAFLAWLLAGILAGRDPRDAVALATAAAGAVCTQAAPLPPDPQIVAVLREQVSLR